MSKKYGILVISAAILVLCFVGASSASEWYVDDDGGADFTRIQDAINSATDGDTVIVRDGTYIENIKVNKSLTIRSENGPDSMIVLAENPDDPVFNVTADYVNISGFTVENATGGCILDAGILLYYADYCNILSNQCSNNSYAIGLWYSNNSSITDNTCSHNSYSVYLTDSTNNSISTNNCSNNYRGFVLYKSDNNGISNNTCSNNSVGIRLASSSRNTIIDNKVIYNGDYGIIFVSSRGIYGFGEIGSDYNIIRGNTVASNKRDGICIYHSSYNIIKENNVKQNEIGISIHAYPWFKFYWLDYSSMGNKIYLNNFINNTNNFFSESPLNSWNSIKHINYHYNSINFTNYLGNYWSNYTGRDTDGDGIGDTPYNISGFTRTSKFFSDSDDYPLVKPFENYFAQTPAIFDTGVPVNPYPSISGIHKGTITSNLTINVSKIYTYPCDGTSGHTEYVAFYYPNETKITEGHWKGYTGDWHNVSFPAFTMQANQSYNYTMRTGSYPQIHHIEELHAEGGMGMINCTSFKDANGMKYRNRIPAIRLVGEKVF